MENIKRFTMKDEKFICSNCGKKVLPLGYTARDHCNFCLYSKHVDINPGDRLENCHGDLVPIAIENFKKSYKIIYKCLKCGAIRKNVVATDDDMDVILNIMSNPVSYE